MTITINRADTIAALRSAYRSSLVNRSLYHTVYLYDDGTTYDFTDVSGSSWLESEHIVACIANYKPDVSGSCLDAYLYGMLTAELIGVYREHMSDEECVSLVSAIADGSVDTDNYVSVYNWLSNTKAYDKVLEDAINWWVEEMDAGSAFDDDFDECIDNLIANGYKIVGTPYNDDDNIVLTRNY